MRSLKKISFMAMLIAMTFSCRKIEEDTIDRGGVVPFALRMMDAPAYAYEEVNIDIQKVEVQVNNSGWVALNTTPRIVNLLKLTNGMDIPLGQRMLPPGTLNQIRITLGNFNTIKVDGRIYRLDIPEGVERSFKIEIREALRHGSGLRLMLDFDAAQSVVALNEEEYQLKPVMRVMNLTNTGTAQGKVNSMRRVAVIAVAFNGVYSTYTNEINGGFMLRGLASGEYDITFYPAMAGVHPVTMHDVMVKPGVVTPVKEVFFNTVVN